MKGLLLILFLLFLAGVAYAAPPTPLCYTTSSGVCVTVSAANPLPITTSGSLNPASVVITGGTINNTAIGATTSGSGAFTTFTAASATIAGSTIPMAASTGLAASTTAYSSNAEQTISFQPGLLTAVTNTKGVFGKFVKASTVDNIVGSALLFTCVGNPTVTLYECGTTAACDSTPTTIGSVTVTAAGIATDGTVSSATIGAGHYVAWAISAGTCTSLDIAATAQIHSN